MPFLYSLSKKGYYIKQIIPCSGFCERSEIFSGLDGFDTGNFTAIGYLPEYSPYKKDKNILRLFEVIKNCNERVYGKLFRIWRLHNNKRLNGYRIPPRSLHKFALTEDGNKVLIPHKNIFDVLEDKRMTYTTNGFTSLSDIGRRTQLTNIELAEQEINKGTYFIPLYIGETDKIGHYYGADIDNIKPTLQAVDNQLKQLFNAATKSGYSFCVMGDHGMVPVTKKLDVISVVKGCRCKLHIDYEAFYDSTMVRFWFYKEQAKHIIITRLIEELNDYGFIVDSNNYVNYRVPLDLKCSDGYPVYGDIVWCAKPGVLVSPDYFHSRSDSENGMHGYIDVVEGHGTGLFVKYHQGILHQELDKAHSSQICEQLCETLEIQTPNSHLWKRMV